MKTPRVIDIGFYCLIGIVCAFFFMNIGEIPFHPDESTQIFMSEDVELFLQSPANLIWNNSAADSLRQEYRFRDAPITRLWIGLGRKIFGLEELKSDWNWSKTWDDNRNAGALPGNHLLFLSRFFVFLFFPASLITLYETGKFLKDRTAGIACALLFLINPLVLLHTRRAMAESALLFSVILCIYFFVKSPKKNWLLAIPVALAFNSKQTAAGLVICALIIIGFVLRRRKAGEILGSLLLFLAVFGLITFLLNPFLWKHPIEAFAAAIQSRQELVHAQTTMFVDPDSFSVLNTLPQKFLSLFGQLFFAPLQFAETSNYLSDLNESILLYKSLPLNSDLSLTVQRALILIFSILGIFGNIFSSIKNSTFNEKFYILLGSFIIFSSSLLFFIPLSFQRYYLTLIPFLVIFSGLGVSETFKRFFHQESRQ